ncbi:hypothetical protein VPH35_099891 [Triticum aestivum]
MIQPDPAADRTEQGRRSSLYVLDLSGNANVNGSFEVLARHQDGGWRWRDLPGPPFLTSITKSCYAVVDSSTICISSAEHGIGTYAFDTASHVWRQVGRWALPLRGKVEYAPEFKLWLGLSDCNPESSSPRLCAMDLSAMINTAEQSPMPQHAWDYLDPPDDNKTVIHGFHLLNLGSGMFCIATQIRTMLRVSEEDTSSRHSSCTTSDGDTSSPDYSDVEMITDIIEEDFVILTGVKVERCRNDAEAPLQMITHKSKRYDFIQHMMKTVL